MTSSSDTLRGIFLRGDDVPVILRHVSRSGLQRTIDVLAPYSLMSLSIEVADVLGLRRDPERIGVIVQGGNMDMLFKLVYDLGIALYDDGYALTYNQL